MKAVLGPTIVDAKNAVGNIVYARNLGGVYTRARVTPTNPKSPDQVGARDTLSTVTKAWSGTLTEAQRAGYRALAKRYPYRDRFGQKQEWNALALFTKLNIAHWYWDSGILADAPANLDCAQPTSFTCAPFSLSATDFTVTFAPGVPANHAALFYACKPQPAGARYPRTFMGPTDWQYTTGATTQNVYTNYTARYGVPTAGQLLVLDLKFFNADNGMLSSRIRAYGTVVA